MISRGQTGEMIMFFVFLFLNFIVVAGIVWGVISFYGEPYDTRYNEAGILADRIQTCAKGHDFFSSEFNISRDCRVNEDVLNNDHLVYVSLGDKEFILGTLDFKNQCLFNTGGNAGYPVCVQRSFMKDGSKVVIITGSNQRVGGLI